MSLKITGSFGPIAGAMKVGDLTNPVPTWSDLEWTLLPTQFANTEILDNNQFSMTVMETSPSSETISTANMKTTNPLVGDFDIKISFDILNNDGSVSMFLQDENGITLSNFFVRVAAKNDLYGGAPDNERGYPSHTYPQSTAGSGQYLRIKRTGSSVNGYTPNNNSGTLTYSGPVKIHIQYYKHTGQLNTTAENTLVFTGHRMYQFDGTDLSEFTLTPKSGTITETAGAARISCTDWSTGGGDPALIYASALTGDFDVFGYIDGSNVSASNVAYATTTWFLINYNAQDYGLNLHHNGSSYYVGGGTSDPSHTSAINKVVSVGSDSTIRLRIKRVGTQLTLYYSTTEISTWTLFASVNAGSTANATWRSQLYSAYRTGPHPNGTRYVDWEYLSFTSEDIL